jgi:hypothetical protein
LLSPVTSNRVVLFVGGQASANASSPWFHVNPSTSKKMGRGGTIIKLTTCN